jgi:hypothetical protein
VFHITCVVQPAAHITIITLDLTTTGCVPAVLNCCSMPCTDHYSGSADTFNDCGGVGMNVHKSCHCVRGVVYNPFRKFRHLKTHKRGIARGIQTKTGTGRSCVHNPDWRRTRTFLFHEVKSARA